MGKENDIEFSSFEDIQDCFEKEWEVLHEMESVGIVKTREEANPAGHGRHKIVELVVSTLKLEAYI